MEPMLFVMAILGCGESDAPCRKLDRVETRYPSEAVCLAAAGTELARRDEILYPSVVAQCRRVGARPQLLRGSDVLLPGPARPFESRPRLAVRSSR